jgi:hypothetical protein
VKSWTTLNKNINIVCWLLFLKRDVCIPVPKKNRMRLRGSITPHVEHAIPKLAYPSLHNNAVIPGAVYKEQGVAAQWRTKYVANCGKFAAILPETIKQTGTIF